MKNMITKITSDEKKTADDIGHHLEKIADDTGKH
jgi:hypothetical protein